MTQAVMSIAYASLYHACCYAQKRGSLYGRPSGFASSRKA